MPRKYTPECKAKIVLEVHKESELSISRQCELLGINRSTYYYELIKPNLKELRAGIRTYIREYNAERPRMAHDYATPDSIYYDMFQV